MDAVRRRLESEVDGLRSAGVADDNGLPFVHFNGQNNHRRPGPLDVLRFIGEQSPAAYGLLFARDAEAVHWNEFKVWRLARGKVQELPDPFLSPCDPVIEDPEPWDAAEK